MAIWVTDEYSIPTNLRWGIWGNTSAQVSGTAVISENVTSWQFGFQSQYKTFQVQYRYRSRYSPAASAAVEQTASEVWTEWGDWTWAGGATDGTSPTKSTTTKKQGYHVLSDNFDFAFDYSTYDAYEYEFRVRGFNEPNDAVSEWAYETLFVRFRPNIPVTAELVSEGVAVTIATDWQRGGKAVVQRYVGKKRPCVTETVSATSDTSDVTVTVPNDAIAGLTESSTEIYVDRVSYYPTGGEWNQVRNSVTFTAHENPSTIPVPQIFVAEETVEVVGTFDNVFVSIAWTDDEDNSFSGLVSMEQVDETSWYGLMTAPPYDVPITIRVVGVADGDWLQTSANATIASNGRYTWTNDTGEASVRLRSDDSAHSWSEELSCETNKALGARRPISTYETGGERSISFSGNVMLNKWEFANAKFTQASHSELLKVLRHEGDSWYRTPGGGRYRVAIKSFSVTAYSNYEDVSVEMSEVL